MAGTVIQLSAIANRMWAITSTVPPTAAVMCMLTEASREVGRWSAGPATPSATETVRNASATKPVIRMNSQVMLQPPMASGRSL